MASGGGCYPQKKASNAMEVGAIGLLFQSETDVYGYTAYHKYKTFLTFYFDESL